MTKVLSDGAKKELLELIKRRGELSFEIATQRTGLAKTTIRQHLIQMEEQGLVRRILQKRGRGRPRLVFELSDEGRSLFPNGDSTMLAELIKFLRTHGHQDDLWKFFEHYWEIRKDRFREILDSLPKGGRPELERRREALTELLEAEGFMPEVRKGKDRRLSVRECNCPFPGAVRATHLPCRLELEFLAWALQVKLERTSFLPDGDSACVFSECGK